MPKPPQLQPATLAQLDQDLAALRELVRAARRHALYCDHPQPGTCAGPAVEAGLEDVALAADDICEWIYQLERLLALSVAALAHHGYATNTEGEPQ